MSGLAVKAMSGEFLKLRNFLPYRLAVLSNRISQSIAERYEERFSLSIPEWRVMAVLGEEPNLSAAEVADRTTLDKVAVSRAVKNLLAGNRLERHFSSDDRRRSVLSLSTNGRQIYEQVLPLALTYEQVLLSGLNQEEQKSLDNILEKLADIQLHTV